MQNVEEAVTEPSRNKQVPFYVILSCIVLVLGLIALAVLYFTNGTVIYTTYVGTRSNRNPTVGSGSPFHLEDLTSYKNPMPYPRKVVNKSELSKSLAAAIIPTSLAGNRTASAFGAAEQRNVG